MTDIEYPFSLYDIFGNTSHTYSSQYTNNDIVHVIDKKIVPNSECEECDYGAMTKYLIQMNDGSKLCIKHLDCFCERFDDDLDNFESSDDDNSAYTYYNRLPTWDRSRLRFKVPFSLAKIFGRRSGRNVKNNNKYTNNDVSCIVNTKLIPNSKCIHCGYGKTIKYLLQMNDGNQLCVEHWEGCLTYLSEDHLRDHFDSSSSHSDHSSS